MALEKLTIFLMHLVTIFLADDPNRSQDCDFILDLRDFNLAGTLLVVQISDFHHRIP